MAVMASSSGLRPARPEVRKVISLTRGAHRSSSFPAKIIFAANQRRMKVYDFLAMLATFFAAARNYSLSVR